MSDGAVNTGITVKREREMQKEIMKENDIERSFNTSPGFSCIQYKSIGLMMLMAAVECGMSVGQ